MVNPLRTSCALALTAALVVVVLGGAPARFAAAAGGGPCPVAVPEVSIARTKVGNKVTSTITIRNVGEREIRTLTATFAPLDADGKAAPGAAAAHDALPAGRSCQVTVTLAEAPDFGAYRLSLRLVFEGGEETWAFVGKNLTEPPVLEAPEPPAEPEPGPAPDPGREPGAPPTPGPANPPAAPAAPAGKSKTAKIELCGMVTLEGEFTGKRKEMRYTGDLHFLKLRFLDGQGKPVRQAGKLEVVAFKDGHPVRNQSNQIGAATYGVDATRIRRADAGERSTAFDAQRNEVWIAFARTEEEKVGDWKLDLRFTAAEGDQWLWKQLERPFTDAPRTLTPAKK